ncbi:MAG: CPBP family intramembrane metalloprotease [Bacteroidetes bacterium]|nr:CPBP family intramembrane metalloprotease [Bacteroidota bacterium]
MSSPQIHFNPCFCCFARKFVHVSLFFLFGVLAGNARRKSGGLLPCIVVHVLNNVVVVIAFIARGNAS